MGPCTGKRPKKPTGLMKASRHCVRPAGHCGGMAGRLGEVLALNRRMPMARKAGINSSMQAKGPH